MIKTAAVVAGVFLLVAGCATAPKPVGDQAAASFGKRLPAAGSFLEINYVRGNNRHRFLATASSDSIQVECYRDRKLVKARKMDPSKYRELVKEAAELVRSSAPVGVPRPGPCRTPFSLRMKDEEERIKTLDGCRSTDENVALGKLINDAEFLVFSEN